MFHSNLNLYYLKCKIKVIVRQYFSTSEMQMLVFPSVKSKNFGYKYIFSRV